MVGFFFPWSYYQRFLVIILKLGRWPQDVDLQGKVKNQTNCYFPGNFKAFLGDAVFL